MKSKTRQLMSLLTLLVLMSGPLYAEDEMYEESFSEAASESSSKETLIQKAKDLRDELGLYGDIRVRLENNFNRDSSSDTQIRALTRFRLGFNFPINEDLTVGARLATGALTDPNSPHATFTGAFDSKNISLDRAFVQWNPNFFKAMDLWLGKFAHPFVSPAVYKELVWDQDVQPEGGALGFEVKDYGILKSLRLVNGAYVLLEQGTAGEAWMDASQLSASFGISRNFSLTVASGFYYYGTVDAGAPGATSIVRTDNGGNASIDTDGDGTLDSFTANFRISDNFFNLIYTGFPMPLKFQGQYFHNFGTGAVRDDGYSFGGSYGELKEQWDWKFYYQYQLVQQDAVFSPFSQDDFLRQTNFKGHVSGAALNVYKNVNFHGWGLIDKLDSTGGNTWQTRLRLDLNVKF